MIPELEFKAMMLVIKKMFRDIDIVQEAVNT